MRIRWPELWMLGALFVVAALVLTFGHIAEEVLEGDSQKFDETVLLFFRTQDVADPIGPPWVEEMARDITALGSYAVLSIVFFAVELYLVLARQRAVALWVGFAVCGGIALSNALKFAFERPRPELVSYGARVFTSSFPSGHAMLSAVTYLTLGALLASLQSSVRLKVYFLGVALLLTVIVGISRVYLGVHYPTDVMAGWCIGAAWAAACWTFFRYLRNRQLPPSERAAANALKD